MKHKLFASMKGQLVPSLSAQAGLREALAQSAPANGRKTHPRRWATAAACVSLLLAIGGAVALQTSHSQPAPHSYILAEGPYQPARGQKLPVHDKGGQESTVTGNGEGGDQDAGMTPEELEQAMLDVGYTQEEIKEYQSAGYQMTWAKWWKFVHQQENSEGDDPFDLDTLKSFSQKELNAPGSELPGGAIVDAPVQGGADAYEKLMAGLNGDLPDWYGGAYIDAGGGLTVLLVDGENPGDKALELQVLDWIDNYTVAFTSAKYSLAHLEELSREITALLDGTGVFASHGINEVENRVDLDLSVQADDKLLSALAKLDPDDDAIRVNVYTQPLEEMPYQKGPAKVKLGEEPVPGGDVDGNPDGYETPVELPIHTVPEEDEPAHYDLLPLDTPSIANEDDALAIEPTDTGTEIKDLPGELIAPAQSVDLPAVAPNEG